MKRILYLAVAATLAALPGAAGAIQMPPVAALQERIGAPPETVHVYEPHLTVGDSHVARDYVGYPAIRVLEALFGPDWRSKGAEVEFRALDGYVSRIPVARFQPGKAFLVFGLLSGAAFKVDNLAQNQTAVPLGPYYLVWDNIHDPEILAQGAHGWPYQVSEIALVEASDAALLPGGMAAGYGEAAALAKTHCLSCHQINGYGGEKFPGNLAEFAKGWAEADFLHWVLAPSEVRPGTEMPPLQPELPQAERERVAKVLYDYLQKVPVAE